MVVVKGGNQEWREADGAAVGLKQGRVSQISCLSRFIPDGSFL